MSAPRIYLAGPMVFYPDPEAVFAQMKAICLSFGMEGVSPLENQIGLEGLAPDRALLERIVRADMGLMDTLDGGLFCLDGFRRSPEMDAGTAFEVGHMRALRKPIAGWTRDPRHYTAKVADHFKVSSLPLTAASRGATGGTSGTTREPDGMLVHSEGCLQNAMIDLGIATSGGLVFSDPDWEIAFSDAAGHLVRRFRA
ncbi:MAG TPA: hypothetical protein DDZ81_19165 [Acetobacteraceae bacterium]|jgi:nucleoside 2-deoxyribosyltransferase|nr:hypothetical protein [Acetobacteraceae bacterium]